MTDKETLKKLQEQIDELLKEKDVGIDQFDELRKKLLRELKEKERKLLAEEIAKEYQKIIENFLTKKIQELKTQQDADYFLTTLLLKPFVNSYINNNKINQALEYDFFIKQKKEFSFKKTSGEIGGDYCCFDEIHLKNKPYLFFIPFKLTNLTFSLIKFKG